MKFRVIKIVLIISVLGLGAFVLRRLNQHCVVINTSKIFDGTHDQYLINKSIVVMNGLIETITDVSVRKPLLCKVENRYGEVILPGLIDSHTHLLLVPPIYSVDSLNIMTSSAVLDPQKRLEAGLRNAKSMLLSGFTTIRDLGNSDFFFDIELRKALESQILNGPRIIASGPGFSMFPTQIGAEGIKNSPKEYNVVNVQDDLWKMLETYQAHKISWIKIYLDNDPSPGKMREILAKRIVYAAHQMGFKVAAHSTNAASAAKAFRVGVDSIEHFYEIPPEDSLPNPLPKTYIVITDLPSDDCAQFFKITGNRIYENCAIYRHQRALRNIWIQNNNMTPVFGSDYYYGLQESRGLASLLSLLALTEEGMSAYQALLSATANPGKMLGIYGLGTVVPGAPADLISVSGDPLNQLQDLRNLKMVMKSGNLVCADEKSCQP